KRTPVGHEVDYIPPEKAGNGHKSLHYAVVASYENQALQHSIKHKKQVDPKQGDQPVVTFEDR
uniref:hypothetical protein n=1 Tax=Aeromonas hydrophila TaxID=644 RepID=UPI003F67D480